GQQLVERAGVDHRSGEDVGADLGALFQHAHAEFASCWCGELLQPNCCGQPGRPATDDDDIVLHRFALHETPPQSFAGSVHYNSVSATSLFLRTNPPMTATRTAVHSTTLPIRWGDMDAQGHVNNTVYFRYMEQARIEWLDQVRERLGPFPGLGIVIVNA